MEFKKILFVVTSHSELGNTGKKTGIWIEEFAAPYFHFLDAGKEITIASPKGGAAPIDPKSNEPSNQTPATVRYYKDAETVKRLPRVQSRSKCPHCKSDHLWWPEDIVFSPALARSAWVENQRWPPDDTA